MNKYYYGPVPYEENPCQVGTTGYSHIAKIECKVYANQLQRVIEAKFGDVPGFKLHVTANHHDMGTYYEVEGHCRNDDEDASAVGDYLDDVSPANWDELAKAELIELTKRL